MTMSVAELNKRRCARHQIPPGSVQDPFTLNLQMSKFCFLFNLRQGVICIAVCELTVMSFALLILVLCAARAEEIFMEAVADSADTGTQLDPVSSRWQFIYKEHTEMHGLQLGTLILFLLYVGIVLTTTHLLTCFLLLYGAIKNLSKLVLPWLCTIFFAIVVCVSLLFVFLFVPIGGCVYQVAVIPLVLITVEGHSWLVVYNYYKQSRSMAAARRANNLLFAYEYEYGLSAGSYYPTKLPLREDAVEESG